MHLLRKIACLFHIRQRHYVSREASNKLVNSKQKGTTDHFLEVEATFSLR